MFTLFGYGKGEEELGTNLHRTRVRKLVRRSNASENIRSLTRSY